MSSETEPTLCPVQVRLLDGSALTATFKAKEPLASVRVYVQLNGGSEQDFTLLSPYPRRVYTEMDMEKPLQELGEKPERPSEKWGCLAKYQYKNVKYYIMLVVTGLVPSAVLVVAKK